jgi:hypothetical protein
VFRSLDGGTTWQPSTVVTRVEEDRPSIVRTGTWESPMVPGASASVVLVSTAPGAALRFSFAGRQITWIGSRGPGNGVARVELDGTVVATVDLYDQQERLQQSLFQSSVLSFGEHTLAISVTGSRNAQATGDAVTLDALDIVK